MPIRILETPRKPHKPSTTIRLRGRRLQDTRAAIFRDQLHRCMICGKHSLHLELDHIRPLHREGTEDRSNLQGLCTKCHRQKTLRERHDRAKLTLHPDASCISVLRGRRLQGSITH